MADSELYDEYAVDIVAPEGLGFGEGVISVQKQINNGELNSDSLSAALSIVQHDREVFVQIGPKANGDGCGDGRITGKMIYRLLDPVTKEMQTFTHSPRRPKIFGGGLIAAASMWRSVEGVPENGQTLRGDREYIAEELKRRHVSFGAHTDTKAHGDNCGCGAIDRYKEITHNAVVFQPQITQALKVMYGEDYNSNLAAITDVFSVYQQLDERYLGEAADRQTMDFIESQGALVKQLEGDHLEALVVLNDEENTTLDQDILRQKLAEQGLSPTIQAFVIDVWRGQMYANIIAEIASGHGADRETAYKRALADFLIRTLAVSATLTAGDQPVLRRAKLQAMALTV